MKKLFSVISLIACIAMLLCGCGGWRSVKSVTFHSIQSDSEVTFKMSGVSDYANPQKYFGTVVYDTEGKSKEETMKELEEKNDLSFFSECGFDFIRMQNGEGMFYFHYNKNYSSGKTFAGIYDMSCDIYKDGEVWLERFPFPFFMLEGNYGSYNGFKIGDSYNCDGNEFLSLVKTLGIWEVEEKEDSFIMAFKEDKIEVVYGDGTVTLQQVSQ